MANIQLLRNNTVFQNKTDAENAIKTEANNLADGTPILARYIDKDSINVNQGFKTILAIVNKISGETYITSTTLS